MKIYEAWFWDYDCRDTQYKYFSSESAANKWQRENYAHYKNSVGAEAHPFHKMTDDRVHKFDGTKKGWIDFLNGKYSIVDD